MTRKFQSFNLFALSCFFLTVESQTGQILPPQNVTLRWLTPFRPELSWAPVENCTYTCTLFSANYELEKQDANQKSPWNTHLAQNDQSYWLSVKTVCGGVSSDPYIVNISYTELVKDVQCVILSPKRTHCFWRPARDIPDLHFFYGLVNEDGSTSVKDDVFPTLQACSSYNYNSGVRTGCDLQANIKQRIFVLFNGTVDSELVRSTFRLPFKVRLPPLNWTVEKNEDKFHIKWIPPDIGKLSDWEFIVNYTECDQIKNKTTTGESTELNLASHCQYCISIKAQGTRLDGETSWADKKCFDADTDGKVLVFVAIMIPLVFAVLTVLTFVCCRKNKDSIFPKVPEPRDFLSDISDNNNKCNVRNLYVPAEEEEACKITLVIDPQNNKHDF